MASHLPDPAHRTISKPTTPRIGGFDASKTWARDTATNRRHILGGARTSVDMSRRSQMLCPPCRLYGPGRNVPRPPGWFKLATSQSAARVPGDGVTSSSVLARRVSKADGSECISRRCSSQKRRGRYIHRRLARLKWVWQGITVSFWQVKSRGVAGQKRLGAFPGSSLPPLPHLPTAVSTLLGPEVLLA